MHTSTQAFSARSPLNLANSGSVGGAPRTLLRLEGAGVLLVSSALFAHFGASWLLFGVLFLLPDLAIVGYAGGPRVGAASYNAAHTLFVPLVLGAVAMMTTNDLLLHVALIWSAHIGFDRCLGYGLKYPTHFRHTHLG